MAQPFPGSLRLFRVAGIDVFLHWSWFVVAILAVQLRAGIYENPVFNAIEYLALFVIVLLHEFGHAFACRQVGGRADYILLWPLGGSTRVQPPPRPGALLWSVAAGPLVNVALLPPTIGLAAVAWFGWHDTFPDIGRLFITIAVTNLFLLIFNLVPVYPLDGGQILQALLWFSMGRAASLLAVSILGMIGALVFVAAAVALADVWLALIAALIGVRAVNGFRVARAMAQVLSGPRHENFACPACQTAPLAGKFWHCDQCDARFDTFDRQARCPACAKSFEETACPECYRKFPFEMWYRPYHQPVGAGQSRVAPDGKIPQDPPSWSSDASTQIRRPS
jgi:Zn-dependent protease